jgi:CMP-N-acetylneuraminic acid synthetase
MAIIPARGGSKGLPRKNLHKLAGRPLLEYTVQAARAASCVARVIVSSDDPEILAVAASAGAEIHRRSAAAASDTATSEEAMREVLRDLEGSTPPLLALLQPTSPLRTAADIDAAAALLAETGADALISVCEPRHHPLKALRVDGRGFLAGLCDDHSPFLPRQNLPRALQPNGAIYLVRTALFLANGLLLQGKTIPYLMDDARSIDIDTAEDIRLAAALLAKGQP